ncbi:glycosyl hydrolase [Stachybotrys elegans]|uniref:Glycosyl hydrolase n=1 Tax=Stachybotrys elegans TaxID=80388 RepID=A0A8K0SPC8_9HYPO|nr:glycosyl hydrolase [Stachybotrys elegans]
MLALVGFFFFFHATTLAVPAPVEVFPGPAKNNGVAPFGGRTTLSINVGQNETVQPKLAEDFPDPCVIQGDDGDWYAFATSGNGHKVQMARASDILGDWERLDQEAVNNSAWTTGRNFWAPDVRRLEDGSYIMYFSGEVPDERKHCVGVARSQNITGPYTLDEDPWECPLEEGGAIDPSGFRDPATGRTYVVYKVDGNAAGSGGDCGAVMPDVGGTPLMLQEVSPEDGSLKIGDTVVILDRIGEEDGPLVEAPNLVRAADGRYVLFYSAHCFTDPAYNVRYAWSDSVAGPYVRAPPLVQTPDFGFEGPGGMTSTTGRVEEGEDEVLLLHGRFMEAL